MGDILKQLPLDLSKKEDAFSKDLLLLMLKQYNLFLESFQFACKNYKGNTNEADIAKIMEFHFHQLRHTYTINLPANGAAPKDVRELLGHSDVSTTINVYAHSTRKVKRESARLLDIYPFVPTKSVSLLYGHTLDNLRLTKVASFQV